MVSWFLCGISSPLEVYRGILKHDQLMQFVGQKVELAAKMF